MTPGQSLDIYPNWVRDIFVLMSGTYGALWNDPLVNAEIYEATKRIWYFQFREFPVSLIRRGILQAAKESHYPPKIYDLLQIIQGIQRKEKDKQLFDEQEKRKTLPKPVKKPASREILEEKLKMWTKLKMFHKVREIENELSALDMQEKGN